MRASYPQLPPGSYTFRAYAEDTGSGVVSAPAEIWFALSPPWWRTGWAKMLGVLSMVGGIAGLWYVLHLALLAQKRRLEHMVEQRTEELEKQANQDALTGLLNRRALFAALTREMEYAHRHQAELCLAIIDLDHFKRVNDTFGHLAGDEVLREAATRLSSVSRRSGAREVDIMGRYGGEEFLVIFKGGQVDAGYGALRVDPAGDLRAAGAVRGRGDPHDVQHRSGLDAVAAGTDGEAAGGSR